MQLTLYAAKLYSDRCAEQWGDEDRSRNVRYFLSKWRPRLAFAVVQGTERAHDHWARTFTAEVTKKARPFISAIDARDRRLARRAVRRQARARGGESEEDDSEDGSIGPLPPLPAGAPGAHDGEEEEAGQAVHGAAGLALEP